jgi:hypothetical protein
MSLIARYIITTCFLCKEFWLSTDQNAWLDYVIGFTWVEARDAFGEISFVWGKGPRARNSCRLLSGEGSKDLGREYTALTWPLCHL